MGGRGPVREEPKSLYAQAIAPHASKLVWYNFREKLPDVSPTAARRPKKPPRADVKIARKRSWLPPRKRGAHGNSSGSRRPNWNCIRTCSRRMCWRFSAPRPAPPPKPKLFVPPPDSASTHGGSARAGGSSGDSHGAQREGRGEPARRAAGQSSTANVRGAAGGSPVEHARTDAARSTGCPGRRRGREAQPLRVCLGRRLRRLTAVRRTCRCQHGHRGTESHANAPAPAAGRFAQRAVFGRPATAHHGRNGRRGVKAPS